MIKMRAGQCWLDFSCMHYHYETQPNPNPLSWAMHNNPRWLHVLEVGVNHLVELVVPWFLLLPCRCCRRIKIAAAVVQIAFQCLIIVGGNLSFLNWLTMVPSLAAFDDEFCEQHLFFCFTKADQHYRHGNRGDSSFCGSLYKALCVAAALLIGWLSVDVVRNLLSSRQVMNTSFDPFRIVNSYGAFGTVGHERFEVVFSMTRDVRDDEAWTEVVFKCKPGPLERRPCLLTPYHYRLDWQIWFAGFPPHSPNRQPWIFLFVAQLLSGDAATIALLDASVARYFARHNVTHIKADMFKYEFTRSWSDSDWWTRQRRSEYLPPLSLQNAQFRNVLRRLSWSGQS